MHRSSVRRVGWLSAAVAGAAAAVALGGLTLAIAGPALAAPVPAQGVASAGVDGVTAGNAAIASVDLSGSWSFTPAGRGTTSITVPGGGWYKQGFTDVDEAVYSRSITVPDSGQPQSAWIEFGAVNHQATLSVDGRVVATQTTAFTPSNFDITAYVTPGTTHTISVDVKGRNALKNSSGKYLVPVAADWCEAVPQGIFRSAFLRVYPAVYVSDAFVRTSVANQTLTYDVSVTNTSAASRSVTLTGSLASDNGAIVQLPDAAECDRHGGRPLDREGDGRSGGLEPRHHLVLVAERALPLRLPRPAARSLGARDPPTTATPATPPTGSDSGSSRRTASTTTSTACG